MKSLEYQNAGYDYKTWQVMQEYLPKHMINDFSRRFKKFDPKDTGVVKTKDVVSILDSMGRKVSPQQIQVILSDLTGEADMSSGMECVDFKEYMSVLSVLMTECIPEDEMYLVFRQFDLDGDGFITSEELKQLVQTLGDEISDGDLTDMMKEADLDGDGRVSYNEFIRVMTNSDEVTNLEVDLLGNQAEEVANPVESRLTCQMSNKSLSDIDDENTERQNVDKDTSCHKEIDLEDKPKVHRTRSFSLGSQPLSMPLHGRRSPASSRRKQSLGELFHFSSGIGRNNGRKSYPNVLEPEECNYATENVNHGKESKRRFSAGAAHLKQLFKRKHKST